MKSKTIRKENRNFKENADDLPDGNVRCDRLMAQTTAGDYSAGTAALTQVSEEIAKYVPIVVKLCYAIAGVVAVVGAISVYIAMNNEEQDVKKKIMMVVGACIFLIAAAQALPLFFGLS